jgi:hypothetical protein
MAALEDQRVLGEQGCGGSAIAACKRGMESFNGLCGLPRLRRQSGHSRGLTGLRRGEDGRDGEK